MIWPALNWVGTGLLVVAGESGAEAPVWRSCCACPRSTRMAASSERSWAPCPWSRPSDLISFKAASGSASIHHATSPPMHDGSDRCSDQELFDRICSAIKFNEDEARNETITSRRVF